MKAYVELVKQLESQKGIPAVKILEAIGESIKSAYKKMFLDDENVKIKIDEPNYSVGVYLVKEVLDEGERNPDPKFYISLKDAQLEDFETKAGDFIEIEINPTAFGLRSAQVAKSKFNDYLIRTEVAIVEGEYKGKIGEIIGGDFQRRQKGTIYINLGKAEGILPVREQSPRDKFGIGDRVKCYIKDVKVDKKKEVKVILSRTDVNFIKKLFEQEIPEVYDKTIEVKGIAREPGKKTKIIVNTKKLNVDPVGACVGMKGVRIQSIVQELNGEMIDVVRWSDNPKTLLASLFKPAEILYISTNETDHRATIVVKGDQLSLAIGKNGLNAKLAAKASGWSIDIKTEDQFEDVRKQEEARLKAEEALGITRKPAEKAAAPAKVEEEIEYEIDESYSLKDLSLPETIYAKLVKAGYDKIEKLIDIDESELIDKAALTVKQAQKVVSVMKEIVQVEESTEDEEEAPAEADGEAKKKKTGE
jgi:N utilization substance protein A